MTSPVNRTGRDSVFFVLTFHVSGNLTVEEAMADPKGLDPFEAFKKKKVTDAKQSVEQQKNDEAAKKLGWIDGIGPADTTKPDPKKPKGFMRGRYTKPPVQEAELQKLKPKKYDDGKFAKPKETPTNPEEDLPPVDKLRPGKFTKF